MPRLSDAGPSITFINRSGTTADMAKLTRRERREARLRGSPILPLSTPAETPAAHRSSFSVAYDGTSRLGRFFVRHHRKLLILPALLLIVSLAIVGVHKAQTGEFIDKGISLKGGLSVTIPSSSLQAQEVVALLAREFPGQDLSVRVFSELGVQKGLIIESGDIDEKLLLAALERLSPGATKDASIETIGATLAANFTAQLVKALLIAFVLMVAVILVNFKTGIPGLAVILAVVADMVMTLAAVNVLGIKVSTAGIAAFLMLIGYSVDTDVLLSTRVLKHTAGTVPDRIFSSFRTGITMTVTTIAAVTVGLLLTQSEVIRQIMVIILIGLVADIINTWITNASILLIYFERKHGKA